MSGILAGLKNSFDGVTSSAGLTEQQLLKLKTIIPGLDDDASLDVIRQKLDEMFASSGEVTMSLN